MLVTPDAFGAEPWRLLLSALPHGGILHIAFNLYWLWVFGTIIEDTCGWARMLLFTAILAAGSSAAEYAVFSGGIGLSGVVYGLFGLLWVLGRRDMRFFGVVDRATVRLFMGWFVLCIVLTYLDVLRIGNVAHAAGLGLGAMLAECLAGLDPGERVVVEHPRRRTRRLAFTAALPVVLVGLYLVAACARDYVNLAGTF
jgi:GlpG protein